MCRKLVDMVRGIFSGGMPPPLAPKAPFYPGRRPLVTGGALSAARPLGNNVRPLGIVHPPLRFCKYATGYGLGTTSPFHLQTNMVHESQNEAYLKCCKFCNLGQFMLFLHIPT